MILEPRFVGLIERGFGGNEQPRFVRLRDQGLQGNGELLKYKTVYFLMTREKGK